MCVGTWDVLHDTVCNVMMLLILEVTVLLLRDVNDCRKVVKPASRCIRDQNLPSSSSSIWSSPTFWPLACFALEPQTIALKINQIVISNRSPQRKTSLEIINSLFHLFCDLLVDGVTEILY